MLKDKAESTPIETDDERDPMDDADTLTYSRVDRVDRGSDRTDGDERGGALSYLVAPLLALLQLLGLRRAPLPPVPDLPLNLEPAAPRTLSTPPGRTAVVAAARLQLGELQDLLLRQHPDRLRLAVLTGQLLRTPLGSSPLVSEGRARGASGGLVGPSLADLARLGTGAAASAGGERRRIDLLMSLDAYCAAETVTACAAFVRRALWRRVAEVRASIEAEPAVWAHLAPLAREVLGYCPPMDGDAAAALWATLAQADRTDEDPAQAWPSATIARVGHAVVLALVLGGCGGALEPVKRTMELKPGGEGYALTLVYPGLHVHHARDLLTQDALSHGERLACAAPQVRLVSAAEETSGPGKDAPEGAPPRSTTKVEGVLVCQAAAQGGP